MNWKLRERGMSLDIMYIFPYIHETGAGFHEQHIGYDTFEWEYDIDLNAFMTTGDMTTGDYAVIFSKSGGWL